MPTIINEGGIKLFFYVNEPKYKAPHIHAKYADGAAIFWLEPVVSVQKSVGLNPKELAKIRHLVLKYQKLLRKTYYELIGPQHKK